MSSNCVRIAIACSIFGKLVIASYGSSGKILESISEGTSSGLDKIDSLRNATLLHTFHRVRRDQYQAPYKVPKNHVLLADYGWSPRQLTSFASTNLLPSQSSSNEYPYGTSGGGGGSEDDNAASAGGHGWGWEQQHGHKYKKSEVNNSAVGMLGFLSLLALIQNVLRQMNNNNNGNNNGGNINMNPPGAAPDGFSRVRGKRSSPEYNSTSVILPYLLQLKSVREGTRSVGCAAYPVCKLCSSVAEHYELGQKGKILIKKTVKAVVSEILSPLMITRKRNEVNELMERSAIAGLKGGRCERMFKDCSK